MPESCRI
ncbi:hypothetical protein NXF25_005233 [Crotalus adamanteus]